MRLRVYGAQVNAGDAALPYVRTTTAQEVHGVTDLSLTWGSTLAYEAADPAWTRSGVRLVPGDRLTASGSLPADFVASLLIRRLPSPLSGWVFRADQGPGLWLEADGELFWGDDAQRVYLGVQLAESRLTLDPADWGGAETAETASVQDPDDPGWVEGDVDWLEAAEVQGAGTVSGVFAHLLIEWQAGRLRLWVDGMLAVNRLNLPFTPRSGVLLIGGGTFDLATLTLYRAPLPIGAPQHVERFTRVLSGALGITRSAVGEPPVFVVTGYGDGFTEVEVRRPSAVTPRSQTFTVAGLAFVIPYLEVDT